MLSHNQLTTATLAPVAEIEGLEMIRVAANRLEDGGRGAGGGNLKWCRHGVGKCWLVT